MKKYANLKSVPKSVVFLLYIAHIHSFMPSSSKYLCSTYNMSGTILGFGERAGNKTDTSALYRSSHSSRGWGGKINTECQRGTYVTKKYNTGKENREWVMGGGRCLLVHRVIGRWHSRRGS